MTGVKTQKWGTSKPTSLESLEQHRV